MLNQFTKQEASDCADYVEALFKAIPKAKQLQYAGEINHLFLFLDRAKEVAPNEVTVEKFFTNVADETEKEILFT